jgi:hypothetical protein
MFLGTMRRKPTFRTGKLVALEEPGGRTHGKRLYRHGLAADTDDGGIDERMEEIVLRETQVLWFCIEGVLGDLFLGGGIGGGI